MSEYIAAYDFGTSGVKGLLADKSGHIEKVCEVPYPLLNPKPLYVEQSPKDYWDAVCKVTREITWDVDPSEVKGLSFSVQAINIIPVDKDGNVLYNAISWLDGRAIEEAEFINDAIGAPVVRSQDLQSRLLWIKKNLPDIYEKTEYFLDCDSFLQYKCTGIMAPPADFAGLLKYDPSIQEYIDITMSVAGIDTSKISPAVQACKVFGVLDEKGASDLGLIPGIPVFGGMIDVPAAAAGCGCLKEKEAHIYLGTSGWLSALLREPVELSEGAYLIPSIDPDLMIYGGCTNACCKMLNWAIDHFYSKEHEEMGSKVFDLINSEASGISAGSDELYATPWLFGEQFPVCDPNARAMFFNINEKHSRAHFINAVMESICFSMKGQLELLKKDAGFTPEVLGADGGGSLSDHWMQMMADVLQVPVMIPENTRHSGALGAALAAAIGLGWCTFDDAGSLIHTDKEFLPRPEYKDLYDKKYENYKMLYEMAKDMFSRLNAE